MNTFAIPSALHEVFGEHQTVLELVATLAFSVFGCGLIYGFYFSYLNDIPLWRVILGFLLVIDILAGCVANVTRGTNAYYAARPKGRWLFIGCHIHIILVAWLLDGPLLGAFEVWAWTILCACVVNVLKGKPYQLFIALIFLGLGLLTLPLLDMPIWFVIVSVFFMMKLVLSFAVDHYPHYDPSHT